MQIEPDKEPILAHCLRLIREGKEYDEVRKILVEARLDKANFERIRQRIELEYLIIQENTAIISTRTQWLIAGAFILLMSVVVFFTFNGKLLPIGMVLCGLLVLVTAAFRKV